MTERLTDGMLNALLAVQAGVVTKTYRGNGNVLAIETGGASRAAVRQAEALGWVRDGRRIGPRLAMSPACRMALTAKGRAALEAEQATRRAKAPARAEVAALPNLRVASGDQLDAWAAEFGVLPRHGLGGNGVTLEADDTFRQRILGCLRQQAKGRSYRPDETPIETAIANMDPADILRRHTAARIVEDWKRKWNLPYLSPSMQLDLAAQIEQAITRAAGYAVYLAGIEAQRRQGAWITEFTYEEWVENCYRAKETRHAG